MCVSCVRVCECERELSSFFFGLTLSLRPSQAIVTTGDNLSRPFTFSIWANNALGLSTSFGPACVKRGEAVGLKFCNRKEVDAGSGGARAVRAAGRSRPTRLPRPYFERILKKYSPLPFLDPDRRRGHCQDGEQQTTGRALCSSYSCCSSGIFEADTEGVDEE